MQHDALTKLHEAIQFIEGLPEQPTEDQITAGLLVLYDASHLTDDVNATLLRLTPADGAAAAVPDDRLSDRASVIGEVSQIVDHHMGGLLKWREEEGGALFASFDGCDGLSNVCRIEPSPSGGYRAGIWTYLWGGINDVETLKEHCQAYVDRNRKS